MQKYKKILQELIRGNNTIQLTIEYENVMEKLVCIKKKNMHPYMMRGENKMYDRLFEPDKTLKKTKIQIKSFFCPIEIGPIEPKTRKTVISYQHFNKFCGPVQTT